MKNWLYSTWSLSPSYLFAKNLKRSKELAQSEDECSWKVLSRYGTRQKSGNKKIYFILILLFYILIPSQFIPFMVMNEFLLFQDDASSKEEGEQDSDLSLV